MRNRAFLNVVLLGLLTFALVPGLAGAASQGQDLTGMLSSSAAERATAVSPPLIDIQPSDHDFGRTNAGSGGSFQFTVNNLGEEDLMITGFSQTNAAAGFTITIPSAPITPGVPDFITVDYLANGSGPVSSNISIFSNDPLHPERLIAVTAKVNNPPSFTGCPSSLAVDAYFALHHVFTATDPEIYPPLPDGSPDPNNDQLNWSFSSVPPLPLGVTGPTFDTNTGTLDWTPMSNAAGTYACTVVVDDGFGGSSATCGPFTLTVTSTNLLPTAVTDGPYIGIRTVDINMSGAGSTDPDGILIPPVTGEALDYAWDFGDSHTGVGKNVSHHYDVAGTYTVSLTVTDHGTPALSNTALTNADISNFIPATIVQPSTGNLTGKIRTGGNGGQQFGIEMGGGRPATDIDPSTIRMSTTYPNAGTAPDCGATTKKTTKIGDLNSNLVGDLDFWIKATDIEPVLIHVPNGTTIEIVVLARTASDNKIVRGTIMLQKKGPSGVTSAAAPNPFRPETSISYSVERSGNVSVRIFSVSGQLVRSLLREEFATPGTHEVRWNGKDDSGNQAPSGIYFVNVRQGSEGSTTRVVLAR